MSENDTEVTIGLSSYVTIRLAFIALTAIFVATLIGFAYLLDETRDLSRQTRALTIQTAQLGVNNRRLIFENAERDRLYRINAVIVCKENIEGVRQIFRPFFPNPPKTLRQTEILEKFNGRVNLLKNNCSKKLQK